MGLTYSILVTAACLAAAFYYWNEFGRNDEERRAIRRWLFEWSVKGVAVPLVVWVAFNSGLIPGLPALTTDMEVAWRQFNTSGATTPGGGLGGWLAGWFFLLLAFMRVSCGGLVIISSYWAGLTLAWLCLKVQPRVPEENRADYRRRVNWWLVAAVPVALVGFWSGGLMALGFGISLCALAVVNVALPLMKQVSHKRPIYDIAIGKMKFGKFEDAEMEIIHELEKCEDDFEGWMMLADLYANHFNDLVGAARTLHDLCNHPSTHPSQMATAMHKLADWHLELAREPVAAREVLEEICRRAPGTHMAHMARLRISQIPTSKADLLDRKRGHTIRLPALSDSFEQPSDVPTKGEQREEAIAHSRILVERLQHNPDDVVSREELACMFAEKLDRVDAGIEQLELLANMPGQPPQKVAEWVGFMAAWRMRYQHDEEGARRLLQSIINNYPDTVQAQAARRRLMLMDVEKQMIANRAAAAAKPKMVIRVE